MRRNRTLIILLLGIILMAFITTNNTLFYIPKGWKNPEYNFNNNPLTKEKIALGKMLFYDPILSRDNTISCVSCHLSFTAFAHVDHALSHGIDNKIGTRNAPALMNLAWYKSFMWDGAINHLDMQPLAPISNKDEMDNSINKVVAKLQKMKAYPALFYTAYNDSIITGENVLKSIAQFMVTIISANSKYDSVMRKQTTFALQEENGYRLFKQNCAVCHTEPLFTNMEFENNGLPVDTTLNDFGRISVTHNSADSLKFKVPTLRNIEFSNPYMHDGRFKKIADVLKHYTSGIHQSKTLAKSLQKPIVLSANERVDLTAFLLTLTDKEFLFNTNYYYPPKK